MFPEPLNFDAVSLAGTRFKGHRFNHFFPWQVNEDGQELETLNHVGRHELGGTYVDGAFTDDPALTYLTNSFNKNKINNFFQIKQDPLLPNNYIGIDAPEFGTHASGQIIRLHNGGPKHNPDEMTISYITDRSTAGFSADTDSAAPSNSGHYRDPVILSDGTLIAAHTSETRVDKNEGTTASPQSRYAFRLKTLKKLKDGTWVSDQPLTPGIHKDVSYYDPDTLVGFNADMWELQPVEVRARPKPERRIASLQKPEARVLLEEGVLAEDLRKYLRSNDYAMIIMRNVTQRDDSDRQQPFNLAVAGSATQTVTATGKTYEIAHFQVFQGDQIRGLTFGGSTPVRGRRVLAQPMHSVDVNLPNPEGPKGSVQIADDGSVAMIVPTRRALSWQLTDSAGEAVVRERNWLSFQPGEIRTCPVCHGLNKTDQAGGTTANNKPEALRQLLRFLKESGDL